MEVRGRNRARVEHERRAGETRGARFVVGG
jgi:hypothetical protein